MITARWLRIKAGAGRVLLLLLVVSAGSGVIWYRQLADDGERQAPLAFPINDSSAEMVTRDFRHVETRMDRTIWVLESARAEIFGEKARLHTVRITWYGEPGMVPVVITSEEGQVNFKSRNAELTGSVRLERADGAVLLTEELYWDERRTLLRAPRTVVISTPDFTFSGSRLDVDLSLEKLVLFGRVKGEIREGSLAASHPS